MSIDNGFTNRYIQYKRDGINESDLQQVRNEVSTKGIDTQNAKALTREIIKDNKIDQDEQRVLQAIGQGAKDINTVQQLAASIDPTNSEISKLIMLGFKNKAQAVAPAQDVSKMGNVVKSKKPIDGQAALDKSFPLGGDSKRRIAFVNNEIVILDQTSPGKFHGHVRTWADLTDKMKNTLKANGLFKQNGKPVK